ncbi:unnamed protein product [Cyclocybe aegerita]|uniref:F-box domain-containing protein n=1 Tax=Cyclocybe aegerita TaxID=1973307 RepID=A0A8S0WV63_CYCAE|nr:unnamed protein product [Cyclocybe aegerita]
MAEDGPSVATTLKKIDKEIEKLEELVLSLNNKHAILLSKKTGAIASIPSLPPDILLEVFHHLLVEDNDSKIIVHPSHVCHLWRETAVGTPLLWTRMLVGGSEEGKDGTTVEEILRKVFFGSSHSGDPRSDTGLQMAEHLHIVAVRVRLRAAFRSINYDSDECLEAGAIDLQAHCALTSFTFDSWEKIVPNIFAVPWTHLTYLKLAAFLYTEQYLQILGQCVNLEACVLGPHTDENHQSLAALPPIHLPKLKHLELLALPLICCYLRTPVIEELVHHSDIYYGKRGRLRDYLNSVGSTLRKVQLAGDTTTVARRFRVSEFIKSFEVLEELTSRHAALLAQRADLLCRLREVHIPTLPPDILLEVFRHLLEDDDNSKGIIHPSHVCRLWRGTAVGSPSLWTRISVNRYDNEAKEVAIIEFAETCTERANGCLMSLKVEAQNLSHSSKKLIRRILEVTRNSKWENIDLSATYTSDFEPVFSGLLNAGIIATVHTLSLTSSVRKDVLEDAWPRQVYNAADWDLHLPTGVINLQPYISLRSFTFDCSQAFNVDMYVVPWTQLTYLKFTGVTDPALYLPILRGCLNLETCVLGTYDPSSEITPAAASLPLVHLPKLRRLELISRWMPQLIPLKIRTPAIEELVLQFESEDDDGIWQELFGYLDSIGDTLQKLQVPKAMARYEFGPSIKLLNVLEELVVSGSFDSCWSAEDVPGSSHLEGVRDFLSEISRAVKVGGVRHYPLPHLRTLEMKGQIFRADEILRGYVLDFMDARIKHAQFGLEGVSVHPRPIERVVYRLADEARGKLQKQAARFESWRKEGIVTVEIED